MSNYVDVVVTRMDCGKRLFRAPAWSYLKPGDKVLVDTCAGTLNATVIDSMTVAEDSKDYEFLFSATNATKPLRKVLSKIVEYEFNYPDEVKEVEDNE